MENFTSIETSALCNVWIRLGWEVRDSIYPFRPLCPSDPILLPQATAHLYPLTKLGQFLLLFRPSVILQEPFVGLDEVDEHLLGRRLLAVSPRLRLAEIPAGVVEHPVMQKVQRVLQGDLQP